MEHLRVHLPMELKVGGPVQYRWMYDNERYVVVGAEIHDRSCIWKWTLTVCNYRFLHHIKGKVGNKARVEASICNAYLMEEITNFIANYMDDSVDVRAGDLPRNVMNIDKDKSDANLPDIFSRNVGYAPNEGMVRFLDHLDHRLAHAYVLSNCGLLGEYER